VKDRGRSDRLHKWASYRTYVRFSRVASSLSCGNRRHPRCRSEPQTRDRARRKCMAGQAGVPVRRCNSAPLLENESGLRWTSANYERVNVCDERG
jgi:hypothetical protein